MRGSAMTGRDFFSHLPIRPQSAGREAGAVRITRHHIDAMQRLMEKRFAVSAPNRPSDAHHVREPVKLKRPHRYIRYKRNSPTRMHRNSPNRLQLDGNHVCRPLDSQHQ